MRGARTLCSLPSENLAELEPGSLIGIKFGITNWSRFRAVAVISHALNMTAIHRCTRAWCDDEAMRLHTRATDIEQEWGSSCFVLATSVVMCTSRAVEGTTQVAQC